MRPWQRVSWRRALGGSLCLIVLLCGQALARSVPSPAQGPGTEKLEALVVTVRLNGVAKGEWFAHKSEQGDFYFKLADLRSMGVSLPEVQGVDIEGEPHLSILSLTGATLNFHEKTLELDVRLPPEFLPRQSINLGTTPAGVPVAPRSHGGFLNYRLGYSEVEGYGSAYSAATELGVNIGPALLLDTRDFSRDSLQTRSVRLQTRLLYDRIDTLQRWVVGDTLASSGELGGYLNLGGLGVSKAYQIDPFLSKRPLVGYSGAVALPSKADIYVDGARVRTEQLAPGSFDMRNLATAYPGLHDIDIVIRDPFGREQHVGFAYFFSDELLARGLDEYSYAAGFQRENYGIESNDYGRFAASGVHRYGWSDALTVGLGGELTRTHINIGPQVTANLRKAGVVSGALALSRDREPAANGTAYSLSHSFALRKLTTRVSLRRYSEDFSVAGLTPLYHPKQQAWASVAYGHALAGTYSVSHALQSTYGGLPEQRVTTLGYNRMLVRNLSLFAQISRVTQGTTGYATFIGLMYNPPGGDNANAQHQRFKDGQTLDQLSVGRTVPVGEGLGYRVLAQRFSAEGQATSSLSPYVQYNARHATWMGEGTATRQSGASGSDSYQVAVAGSVARVANNFYLSRPIHDSYGLVQLGAPLSGVRVMTSGTEIGRTDESGEAFLPNLGAYQVNRVSVKPEDVPLDYSMSNSVQVLRPPLRSGAVARFDMVRVRAVTGRLKYREGLEVRPIVGDGFVVAGRTGTLRLDTVRGGEFYLENAALGRYAGELTVQGKRCRVEFAIPESAEIVTDLGDIYCEAIR